MKLCFLLLCLVLIPIRLLGERYTGIVETDFDTFDYAIEFLQDGKVVLSIIFVHGENFDREAYYGTWEKMNGNRKIKLNNSDYKIRDEDMKDSIVELFFPKKRWFEKRKSILLSLESNKAEPVAGGDRAR